jgi:hypothetical protein
MHDQYPEHVLHTPRPDLLVATQLTDWRDLLQLSCFAEEALGPGAQPTDVCCYPLCVRLPLVQIGPLAFHVPTDGMHMSRLWPARGNAAFMTTVRGRAVEFRIDGNREGSAPASFAATAFVGRAFETNRRAPRARFFAADARHVLLEPNQAELELFTAALVDRLLSFVYKEGPKLGVFVDPTRPLPGNQLAKVYKQELEDDVQYRIRLPLPQGRWRQFVGFPP